MCLGPLNLLQIGAWAGMLDKYSQDFDAFTAVEMTFNGEHPCPLCLTISEARQSSEKSPSAPLPEQNQLRLDPFLRSRPLEPEASSLRSPTPSSAFGLIALLECQTIPLDIPSPPPDASLAS